MCFVLLANFLILCRNHYCFLHFKWLEPWPGLVVTATWCTCGQCKFVSGSRYFLIPSVETLETCPKKIYNLPSMQKSKQCFFARTVVFHLFYFLFFLLISGLFFQHINSSTASFALHKSMHILFLFEFLTSLSTLRRLLHKLSTSRNIMNETKWTLWFFGTCREVRLYTNICTLYCS